LRTVLAGIYITNSEWLWFTIGANILVGIATLPFFAHEMPKDRMGMAVILHLFVWTVFGPVLLVWLGGYGTLRYCFLWQRF